jgi:hypothetical protein
MNKEKRFEIEIAKEFGQELVDKIKELPDETHSRENYNMPIYKTCITSL